MKAAVKRERFGVRAMRAEQTRQRIMAAAERLFLDHGYAAATIQMVAAEANVAVETVYARFRNKLGLLEAILEQAILPAADGRDILEQPEVQAIRGLSDQREQLRQLARFSRRILERTDVAHRVLRSAAEADVEAARLQERDTRRRVEGQREYVAILLANGPLREDIDAEAAADTYSVLASPDTYAFLVHGRGWTPERFELWLGDSLEQLLLLH
jgi:AcrR family transcriptional regulator